MYTLSGPTWGPTRTTTMRPCIHMLSTGLRASRLRAYAAPKRGKARQSSNSKKSQPDWVDLDSIDPHQDLTQLDWGGYAQAGSALGPEPSQALVRCHDKNRLKPALRAELARRLRREAPEMGVLTGHIQVLRVHRYALDDLRLFKAIHEAGMEGRIVVVDDPSRAHVVLATRKTRTGREAPMDNARRLAANLDIPYIQLDVMSSIRLMEAVAPLMGIPIPEHLLIPKAPPLPVLRDTPTSSKALQVMTALQRPTTSQLPQQPATHNSMPTAAPMTIGSLLKGMAGTPAGRTTTAVAKNHDSIHTAPSPSSAQPQSVAALISKSTVSSVPAQLSDESAPHGPRSPGTVQGSIAFPNEGPAQLPREAELQLVDGVDVEDARDALLPPNPTARVGLRHKIARPIKHGRRQRMRMQLKQAAEERAPW